MLNMSVPPGGNTPHQDVVGMCEEIRAEQNVDEGRVELITGGSANPGVAHFRSLSAR
jgi:hypothetical protein